MTENKQAETIKVRLTLRGEDILVYRINKLNRRAARLGVSPVQVNRVSAWETVEKKNTAGQVTERLDWADFEISTEVPCMKGWSFVCRIEHTAGGNIVSKAPHVEGMDLSKYYTGPATCEHCNKPRNRKDTFVVCRADGELLQIGSSCLEDVLGLGMSPESVANLAVWLSDFYGLASGESYDDFDGEGGSAHVQEIPVESYLAIVSLLIEHDGYISRAYARENERVISTSDDALWHISPPSQIGDRSRDRLADKYGSFPIVPSDENKAEARAAIEWAKALPGKNDFEHNMKVIAGSETAHIRNSGVLAYIVQGYRRSKEIEAERKAKDAGCPASYHFGEIGKRAKKVSVTFLGTPFTGENDFGTFYIHRFVTDDGAELVWKSGSSVRVEPGTKMVADFTPKKHGEFRDRPQTEIQRMKYDH